jgi:hypothetical protein
MEFKFEMESLVYFKIHEVWEKVPITKVAPNHIFSLQEFSRVFITLLSIFLAMRIDFGVYLKSENPFAWGTLVSCNLGRFLLPLATRGNTMRHLLPHAGIKAERAPDRPPCCCPNQLAVRSSPRRRHCRFHLCRHHLPPSTQLSTPHVPK